MWMISISKMFLKGATCKDGDLWIFAEKADLRAENVQLVSRPGYLGWHIM